MLNCKRGMTITGMGPLGQHSGQPGTGVGDESAKSSLDGEGQM